MTGVSMSWLAVRRIVLVDGSAVGPVLLLPFSRGRGVFREKRSQPAIAMAHVSVG